MRTLVPAYKIFIEYNDDNGLWPITVALSRGKEELDETHGKNLRTLLRTIAERILELEEETK